MSTESCKPIKVLVTPDCTQCYKTTVETVAYDYDELNPLNYITFPLDPNADDIHVGLFNGHTVWYKYTGTQWQVEGSRLGVAAQQNLDWDNILNKPLTFPPTNHTHSTYESQILDLQNDVDAIELEIDGIQTNISTLDIADISGLQGALDTLQDNIDLLPGDGWGIQVVERTSAFTGDGTNLTPLGLADSAVTNTKIADGSISTTKIMDGQINNLKLGNGAVIESKIDDLAVTTNKIAANAVTTAKILNANVTSDKLAADSVITSKILDLNVTTAKIADNAVTVGKLPSGAVAGTVLTGAGTWLYPPLTYVESVLGSSQSIGTGAWTQVCYITLTPGTWLINAQTTALGSTETNYRVALWDNTNSFVTESYGYIPSVVSAANNYSNVNLVKRVTIGVDTQYRIAVIAVENGFTLRSTNAATYLVGTRIA